MKKIKKILILGIVIALLLSMTVIPTYAAVIDTAGSNSGVKFDETSVLDDLGTEVLDNLKKNSSNYDDVSLLTFVEYCFSEIEGVKENYGLYFYIYNPKGRLIFPNFRSDSVQIGTEFDDSGAPEPTVAGNSYSSALTDYESYYIDCVDYVDDVNSEWYNKLFKFKVSDPSELYKKMLNNKDSRSYYISGIELRYASGSTAINLEFPIGNKFTCTGYAEGCSVDPSAPAFSMTADNVEVLQLDVHSTDWLTASSDVGKGYRYQVASVYFAVDNSVLEKYGQTLQRIKAEWWQYRLAPVLVTDNEDYKYTYDVNDVGHRVSTPGVHDEKIDITLTTENYGDSATPFFDFAYNVGYKPYEKGIDYAYNYISIIPFCFYTDDVSNLRITSFMIKNSMDGYGISVEGVVPGTNYSKNLFVDLDKVDENGNKVYGYKCMEIEGDTPIKLNNYDSNHNWWDKFCDNGLIGSFLIETDDIYKQSTAIEKVTENSIFGTDAEISDNLKVALDDVCNFKEFCYNSWSNEKTVFLFRYAVSDYWSREVFTSGFAEDIIYDAELRQSNCYLGFDIISLTFKDDYGVLTTLPVAMSPIDIFLNAAPSVTTGTAASDAFDDFKNWLKELMNKVGKPLLVILGIIVFFIFSPVLVPLLVNALRLLASLAKLLMKIFSMIFKGIANILNLIFGGSKKKKKKT